MKILVKKFNNKNEKLVEFYAPAKLIELVDQKIEQEGIYKSRTELLNHLLRKYVGLD